HNTVPTSPYIRYTSPPPHSHIAVIVRPDAARPASSATPRLPSRRAHPPRPAPPDTAPDRSLGGGALLLRPPEQPALVPARPRAPAPALLRPSAAPPEPPASTASATSTTSRPAPSRGSRDSGCFMPDQRRRHTRFGKRTASETPERDELTAALLQ